MAYSAMSGSSQPYTVNQAAALAKQYKSTEITTASPEELLIMLYDGAIRFLKIAKKAMLAKDIEKTHNHLIKAQRILSEFMLTLDMEAGGDIAKNLYALYEYLHFRLVHANIKKDTAAIDEVIGHLEPLKKTWEQAIEQARSTKASPSAAASSSVAPLPGEAPKPRIQATI
ncbi:MAG: flagellar export chaperone FliS [Vampirovibrionales bacterium]